MLKLNIGFNRKIGEANYGSRGASVNLEIEVDSGAVREPDKLQAKIDYLFKLAKASVDSQLNGASPPQQSQPAAGNNAAQTGGNGQGNGNGNGHRASEKQINFANQLAKGIRGLGTRRLESLTGRMFGKPLADLSSLDASSLIDTLKAIKEGRVSLDAAFSEGTAA